MQMFVDENTTLLDPTCGSGSALRAAESLGARHVLGLEKDEEYAKGQSAQCAISVTCARSPNDLHDNSY